MTIGFRVGNAPDFSRREESAILPSQKYTKWPRKTWPSQYLIVFNLALNFQY